MRRAWLFGSLAFLLPLTLQAAHAEDCAPLKQINSVDIAGGPNRPLIQVGINDVPKLFLLDTGGDISQINGTVATELGLTLKEAGIKMLDLYGNASNHYVTIEKFTIGHQAGNHIDMVVQPNPHFGEGTQYVGIFAPDLMGRYDVEFDFAAHKMNYFSKDHCAGHVIYWPHQALAVAPMTFRRRHIVLPVMLDGKELRAEIDTGSGNTNMSAASARRVFGIEADTPGNIPLNTPGMAAAFGRVFGALDFEGVAVKNAHVVIRPDLVGTKDRNNGYKTGSHVEMEDTIDNAPDILIGMDILRRLHLYVAFNEERIYITEATPPAKPVGIPATSDATASSSSAAPP
jgi:predicted aspartyl protease